MNIYQFFFRIALSFSRGVKPQILEIFAIETLYLLAVVLTENNWRIPLQVCKCYESYRKTILIIIYFTAVNNLSQFQQFFSFINLNNF